MINKIFKNLLKDLKDINDPTIQKELIEPILKYVLEYFAPYFILVTVLLSIIILLLIVNIYMSKN